MTDFLKVFIVEEGMSNSAKLLNGCFDRINCNVVAVKEIEGNQFGFSPV